MANEQITLDLTVSRSDSLLASDLDGETVVMDVERAHYYGINPIGSVIWSLLSEPIVVRELCNELVARFNVPQEQCETDVLAFLESMQDRNMIRLA